ncbi:MAG: SEC-C metal-binding domain-containing protein [Chloroflexota bacterium]|nr:SEC-C metal-binding domain-containing protein [Chloroflexota bacterium]
MLIRLIRTHKGANTMQEYKPPNPDFPNVQEFFESTDAEEQERMEQLDRVMNERAAEAESKGYTVVGRRKISRNDPCPCGSGKKFKKCCISMARGR